MELGHGHVGLLRQRGVPAHVLILHESTRTPTPVQVTGGSGRGIGRRFSMLLVEAQSGYEGIIGSDVANDRDSSQIQARGGPDLLLAARGRRSLAMQASIDKRLAPLTVRA